jgi:peroxiredoxin
VDRKVGMTYGAVEDAGGMAKRSSYLIDPQGKIAHVWPHKGVTVGTHPAEVLKLIA